MSGNISLRSLPDEAQSLGNPVAEYSPAGRHPLLDGVLALAFAGVMFAAMFWGLSSGYPRGTSVSGTVGLIAVVVAIWQFTTGPNRRMRVVVFEKGLVHVKGGKPVIVPWDGISSVYQVLQTFYSKRPANMMMTPTFGSVVVSPLGKPSDKRPTNPEIVESTHLYVIVTQDGTQLLFNDTIKNVGALGKTIQGEVTRRLLPKYTQALVDGKTVSFGRFVLSHAGIGTQEEIISWDEFEAVRVNDNIVSIFRKDKPTGWAGQEVFKTPNLYVLMALIEKINIARKPQQPQA